MKSTNPAGPPPAEGSTKGTIGGGAERRAELIRQLRELSGQAADASGGFDDAWIALAERPVRLRFAGPALAERLLPALAHLRIAPAESDDTALTVHVWDSESTGTPPPAPLWGNDDFRQQGVIRGFFGEGFFTVFDWNTRTLNVVDQAAREAFAWTNTIDNVGLMERAAPLRMLINLSLIGAEAQLVHAAAIGRPDGCVLLIGSARAGKTTTSLSCLESDLGHIGDDYCIVFPGEPPIVHSLYCSGKVEPATLDRLPGLRDLIVSMPVLEGDKVLLDLHSTLPGKMLERAPLRAVVIPRISQERDTRSQPVSGGAGLAAVAPSTIFQLPGNGEPALRRLSAIMRSVPCHRLDVGTDPARVATAIERILDAP
jgi:hypothetical protein